MNVLVGKTTLNFNMTIAYLLEIKSMKKSQESSSSGDQALTILDGTDKVKNHKKKKRGKRKGRHTCYLYDKEDYMINDHLSLNTIRGSC